ncbi:MAG: YiiD C-terminal domain-containing protein [Xanthomonadales bacterium]|nr:YiiD C-terminal domain-containing protein [Xanthomonadales bacterium]
MTAADPLRHLERHYAMIPLTRAMGLRVARFDGAQLVLAAPLAANINDKGCAFGGSLASLMTLAGWGWIELATHARDLAADIYVKDSRIRYLAPVWQDFEAVARPAREESAGEFLATLAGAGKARLSMACDIPLADGTTAATLEAEFVALTRR